MRDDEIRRILTADFPGTRLVEQDGDAYAVHHPDDGPLPEHWQPWATVVTSDAHDTDPLPALNEPGAFRLNVGLPQPAYRALTFDDAPPGTPDVVLPHPVYGELGWVCVICPDRSWAGVRELLAEANAFAVRRHANAARRRV